MRATPQKTPAQKPRSKPSTSAKPGGPVADKPAPPPKVQTPEAMAVGWMHTAKFLTTAAQLHHLPPHDLPEIAFVGRSNAGKSTCINTLTQQKRLAFASKTPGRTQHINLFSLGKQGIHDAVLADLPGYGYAAVPKDAKYRWQQVMANYLVSRENLVGIVMLCDSRHGIQDIYALLLELIRLRVEAGLPFVVLLTKSDKLYREEATKSLSISKLHASGGDVMLFSSTKKVGTEALSLRVRKWVEAHHEAAAASAAAAAAQPEVLPVPAAPAAV